MRRQVLERGITVGVIGTPAELIYNYEHIGNGVKSVIEIAEGRHPFCSKIANVSKLLYVSIEEKNNNKHLGKTSNGNCWRASFIKIRRLKHSSCYSYHE